MILRIMLQSPSTPAAGDRQRATPGRAAEAMDLRGCLKLEYRLLEHAIEIFGKGDVRWVHRLHLSVRARKLDKPRDSLVK
jgi:hypothetical protein